MEALVLVLVILGVVTLVGHGLWCLLRWLVRLALGPGPSGPGAGRAQASRPPERAPPSPSATPGAPLEELQLTSRRVTWLWEVGLLDGEACRKVCRSIAEAEHMVGGGEPLRPAAVVEPAERSTTGEESAEGKVVPTPAAESRLASPAGGQAEPAAPAEEAPLPPGPRDYGGAKPAFGETLAAFMEKANIRWGELVGAMLVLFSSTALVINQWSNIQGRILLQYVLFTGITVALFGVGLYSERRWKLPTTSRGVLILATLLVPLDFLALVAVSHGGAASSGWLLGGTVAAALIFCGLTYLAAQVYARPWPALVTVAVMAPSVLMLPIRRFAAPETGFGALVLLGGLPLAVHAATVGGALRGASRWRFFGSLKAHALFAILGLGAFAVALSLGLLAYLLDDSGGLWDGMRRLALAVSFYGVPAMACGIFFWRRLDPRVNLRLALAGTGVGVLGALVNLGALILAWPDPLRVLAISISSGILFTSLAFLARLPAASWLAGPCWVVAYLLGFHVLFGELELGGTRPAELAGLLFSGRSGNALILLVATFAAIGGWHFRRGRTEHGSIHALLGVGAAVLSIALLTYHGFGTPGDPLGIAWSYGLYAAASLFASWIARRSRALRPALIWCGLALFLAALIQFLVFGLEGSSRPEQPLLPSLLLHASATLVAASLAPRLGEDARRAFVPELLFSTVIVAATAGVLLAVFIPDAAPQAGAVRAVWLTILLWKLAFLCDSPGLFSASQLVLTFGTLNLAACIVPGGAPPSIADSRLLEPANAQTLGMAVGLLSLLTCLARGGLRRVLSPSEWRVVSSARPRVDHVFTALVAGAFFLMLLFGLAPGLAEEWVGRRIAVSAGFFGARSWILWTVLLCALIASLREDFGRSRALLTLLALFAVCALVSGRGVGRGWTLSALRWSLAGFFAAGSALIWAGNRWVGWFRVQERGGPPDAGSGLLRQARLLLLFLAVAPVLAVTVVDGARFLSGFSLTPPAPFFRAIGLTSSYTAPLIVISATLAGFAVRERLRRYLVGSSLVLNLAATIWFVTSYYAPGSGALAFASDVVALNVLVLALTGMAFLPLEFWILGRGDTTEEPAFHTKALCAAGAGLAFVLAVGLGADLVGHPIATDRVFSWTSLLAMVLLALSAMRATCGAAAPVALYFLSLAVPAMIVDRLDLAPWRISWSAVVVLAAFTCASGFLWRRSARIRRFLFGDERVYHEDDPRGLRRASKLQLFEMFLSRANSIAAVLGAALAAWIVLSFAPGRLGLSGGAALVLRLAAAGAVLVEIPALLVLRRGENRRWLEPLTLAFGAVAPVFAVWALIKPGGGHDDILHRSAVVVVTAVAITWLYGWMSVAVAPSDSSWRRSLRLSIARLAVVFSLAVVLVLRSEVVEWLEVGDVAIHPLATGGVLLALGGAVASLLCAAVVPAGDPLSLPERQRMVYVYAAEFLLALAFLHVRATMPWLFRGFFTRNWPHVAMALAFLGVGLGELFSRRGLRVLAEPFGRTAVFLPVLPVVGFWFLPSAVDYTALLVVVSVLYAGLSLARKSFGFGLLAVIAANGGLWYYLNKIEGMGILDHPQLWLIPLALSVLLASYLHRRRIPEERLVEIRYACLAFIYLSSTADIFLSGIAASPWLPLLLAFWSVLGVAAGILARVRSFLFLGSTFLLLALVTMIWHASSARGWTWLWYVAGIALGMAIIAVIALFEKKRVEMLRLFRGLKDWEK